MTAGDLLVIAIIAFLLITGALLYDDARNDPTIYRR